MRIRFDIQRRIEQVHARPDAHRSGVRAEQRALTGVMIQQTLHRQCDGRGLVAAREAIRRLLDQGDHIGTVDRDNLDHGRRSIINDIIN